MRTRCTLLVLLMVAGTVAAGSEAPRFRHLTLADELPESSIYCIAQDRLGFIWLGTSNGLLRYDGSHFERFQPDPVDRSSLSGRMVTALIAESDGSLWVGTWRGGLNRYEPATTRFHHYRHHPKDQSTLASDTVGALLVDRSGALWVGSVVTESGGPEGVFLSRLDRGSEHFSRMRIETASDAEDGVSAMVQDSTGMLWIGTRSSGLLRYDPETGTCTALRHDPDDPGSLSDDRISALISDRRGRVWIGTWGGGLQCLDPGSGQLEQPRFATGTHNGLSDNRVMSLCEARDGALWIGTRDNMLHRYDPESNTLRRLRHDPADPGSRSAGLGAWVIFEDRTETLWVGAEGVGLDLLDPYANKGQLYRHDPRDPGSLGPGNIQSLLMDRSGALWVGTTEGLSRLDPRSRRGVARTQAFDRGVARTQAFDRATRFMIGGDGDEGWVHSLLEDRRGRLWVGTQVGLYTLAADRDPEKKPRRWLDGPVSALLEDGSGKIWVGTWTRGLELLDPESGALTPFVPGSGSPGVSERYISALLREPGGILWVGTAGGGLNRLDPATGGVTILTSSLTGLDTILALHQDHKGRLWVGTESGGLHLVEPEIGTRMRVTERDGLAHDTVHSIVEDSAGRLWLGTGRGLSSFDPETRQCRTYDASDGLLEPRLSGGAARGRDGTIYLGSPAGVHSFRPDRLEDDPHPPPVVLTGLQIFNKPIDPGPGSPLAVPMPLAEEIRLEPEHRVFTLEFAALHYAHADRNRYAFRLDPFDSGWNQVGSQRRVTYSNLAPGEYVFRVKAANSDGVWNEEGTSLRIIMTPPWWRTHWAAVGFTLAAVLILAGVAGMQRWWVQRRERMRSEQREARLRAEAAEAQARVAEAEARIVRQESRRKSAELEAARDLQLSMLPEALPKHPSLRIAASMSTATEVGGDYYDFDLSPDGSLLAALGDASGHGLRAGMVVMTAKSLFVSLPSDPGLANALTQGNRILRRMRLGRLNMALALVRVTADRIEAASAGVPPALVYCSRDGTVHELGEGGVPLGGMPEPTYHQTAHPFAAGDVVLLMSDGFPELCNAEGEQLGYERAREAFREAAAQQEPEAVVAALLEVARAWSGGRPRDDDMTFVVISRDRGEGAGLARDDGNG